MGSIAGIGLGCDSRTLLDPEPNGPLGATAIEPDEAEAIAAVVEHTYGLDGQSRILFIGTHHDSREQLGADQLEALQKLLTNRLAAAVFTENEACTDVFRTDLPVLTPIDCDTGQPGVLIRVGRLVGPGDDDYLVNVLVARSGLDGAAYEYTLTRAADDWLISDWRLVGTP